MRLKTKLKNIQEKIKKERQDKKHSRKSQEINMDKEKEKNMDISNTWNEKYINNLLKEVKDKFFNYTKQTLFLIIN